MHGLVLKKCKGIPSVAESRDSIAQLGAQSWSDVIKKTGSVRCIIGGR